MTAGIYYIENKITGKIYYGRTKNYEKRYGNNPIWAKHHNRELRDDAIKYGNEKFSYELVIETSPDFETLRAYENAVRDYFINTNQWDETYNRAKTDGPIDISGNNNPAKRPEVRAKISLKLKNKPKSIEHRLKISKTTKEIRKNPEIVIAMTGKKHTEETITKMKMSAHYGDDNAACRQDVRLKISIGNAGEKNGNARLTWSDVSEIRTRYAAGETIKVISSDFKMGYTHIREIIENKKWKIQNKS